MRQPRCELTSAAEADLEEIWSRIAEDNLTAADRLLDAFYDRFEAIAFSPGLGRLREELQPGIRSFPVGNYLIFYRSRDSDIQVVRVLHGARDLPAHF